MTGPRGPRRFLVVEDDPIVANAFVSNISRHAPAVSVASVAEARVARRNEQWIGIVLDVRLPDGNGLEFLQELRAQGDKVPVLVATGHFDPFIANACHRLDAHCVFKPDLLVNLLRFVGDAIAAQPSDELLQAVVKEITAEFDLTIRESQIATLVARGVPRDELAETMGVTNNTVKTIIRGLLGKLNETSVEAAARLVLERMVERARRDAREPS